MTKSQIQLLTHNEMLTLANQKNKKGSFTTLAILAQEVLWEDSWSSIKITNEPNPFDYEPFSMED